MNEGFEVNKKELAKQMEEEILKGKHLELKILVGEGSKEPMCMLANTATFKEIGLLYNCLEETKKMIERRYPASVLYAKAFLELDGSTEIEIGK